MQRMVMGRDSGKKPPRRCFVTKTAAMQGKGGELTWGLLSRVKESQKGTHPTGPCIFVMLGVWNQFEMQVLIVLPAALDESIVKGRDILHRARTFLGAGIQPDARTRFNGSTMDKIENGSLVPPHGRRKNRQFAEDICIFEPEINREQAAERRSAEAGICGFRKYAIIFLNKRF